MHRRPGSRGALHNPFCSERVRPGALAFVFGPGESLERLLERWRASGMRGQVVGPHGSGKSALLAHVAQRLRDEGRCVFELRASEWTAPAPATPEVCVLDEADSWPRALRLVRLARLKRRGVAILAATHSTLGLPTVFAAQPSAGALRSCVEALGVEAAPGLLDQVYSACGGNIRLALFALYDLWEAADVRLCRRGVKGGPDPSARSSQGPAEFGRVV